MIEGEYHCPCGRVRKLSVIAAREVRFCPSCRRELKFPPLLSRWLFVSSQGSLEQLGFHKDYERKRFDVQRVPGDALSEPL